MTPPASDRAQIELAYPAARRVGQSILDRLTARIPTLRETSTKTKATPSYSVEDMAEMIDAAFWASLRKEEGYAPRISAVLLPPESADGALRFEDTLPFTANVLARLAPAVERPGIHLGVWRTRGGLQIWGTTRATPKYSFVLEVNGPGVLIVKQSRGGDSGKFANVAVLEGDRVKLLSPDPVNSLDCPGLVQSLLGFEEVASPAGDINPLVLLAVSMRAHGRGGSLLVVPTDGEDWRHSTIDPIRYRVSPPFTNLSSLTKKALHEDRNWQDQLQHAVDEIAGLTAVDGATIINDSYELLAFGAKIGRVREAERIEQIIVTEPVVGAVAETMHPTQLGGTRHLSAAQFVHDQRDALALIASQDGRFTIFAWSPCEQMVHAHRVESLLV
jgi:hypothetical protein